MIEFNKWNYFFKKEDIQKFFEEQEDRVDIYNIDWRGEGFYYIKTGSQRCPRNCCYDTVYVAEFSGTRIDKIKQQMVKLENELKQIENLS